MRAILLATTAALALSTTAWAASNSGASSNGQNDNPKVRQELTRALQKSGFTDIRVAPTSFMVRAKDQDGNPVLMSIGPDQFAEMTISGNTPRSEWQRRGQ